MPDSEASSLRPCETSRSCKPDPSPQPTPRAPPSDHDLGVRPSSRAHNQRNAGRDHATKPKPTDTRTTARKSAEGMPHRRNASTSARRAKSSARKRYAGQAQGKDLESRKEGAEVRLAHAAAAARLATPCSAGARSQRCVLLACSARAGAFASVMWRLDSNSAPTYLRQGSEARMIATASNLGEHAILGSGAHPVTITDKLPADLRVPATVRQPRSKASWKPANAPKQPAQLECAIEEAQRKEVSCKTTPSDPAAGALHRAEDHDPRRSRTRKRPAAKRTP